MGMTAFDSDSSTNGMLETGWEKSASDLAKWLDQKVDAPRAAKDSRA